MLNWRKAPETEAEREKLSQDFDSAVLSKYMKLVDEVESTYEQFNTELYRRQARIVLSRLLDKFLLELEG